MRKREKIAEVRIKAKMERVKARMIQKEKERKAKVNHAGTSTVKKVVDMDKMQSISSIVEGGRIQVLCLWKRKALGTRL